jgi:hypothetical protein
MGSAPRIKLLEKQGRTALVEHEDLKTTMKYLHPDTGGSAAIVNHRNRSKLLRPCEGGELSDFPQSSRSRSVGD